MNILHVLRLSCSNFLRDNYSQSVDPDSIQVEPTSADFKGDFTIIIFPFLRITKKSPVDTGNELGRYMIDNHYFVESFDVIKGFLNIALKDIFWIEYVNELNTTADLKLNFAPKKENYLIEYSSPNTNKPLHLGHIRNNLIGHAIAEILKARGHTVSKVNLINDRGIHICKSMLAWQKFGEGKTPASEKIKGDHFVGDYYVLFASKEKEEKEKLMAKGVSEEEAVTNSDLMLEAREYLKKWENQDEQIIALWKKMNDWVYEGFEKTYKRMGIGFDKVYYESQTYQLGKSIVEEGLKSGKFYIKQDGSVWVNLEAEGLDDKLLLRSDGTSVYVTQDLGTAELKFREFSPDHSIYIVGNEQDHHFNVLKAILRKLNKPYAESIFHLSYGMVELPEGKMKSREGTVVDADDLMDEMMQTAMNYISESGKSEEISQNEQKQIAEKVGMAALKYHILKVDVKKNITFNPKESIDFQGHTGPFIQYTYARIISVFRKGGHEPVAGISVPVSIALNTDEKEVIRILYAYNDVLEKAESLLDPSSVAAYLFQLAKAYNKFYHDNPILKENDKDIKDFRLLLSAKVALVLNGFMHFLGIDMPEKM